MQGATPATGHDVDIQGPAQLVPADRSGRRLSGLRANSLGICVMIIAQMILGAGVNLYVHVPAADQGHGLAAALGRALTSQPATLAAHAVLGTLLLAAGVSVLVRAIRARTDWQSPPRRPAWRLARRRGQWRRICQRQPRGCIHGHGGPYGRCAPELPRHSVRRARRAQPKPR